MACSDDPNCQDTEQIDSADLPLWDGANLPPTGKLVLLVEQNDYDNGGKIQAAYRLPLNRVVPGSAPQSVLYSLNDPDAGIDVAEDEIFPAYVEGFGSFDLKKALATASNTKARFIITGKDPNIADNYIIQGSGFYSFPTVHTFTPGNIYYLSDTTPGGVTNTPPGGIAQPLFYVVDQKTILITIGD
jgi:hypothetical protein